MGKYKSYVICGTPRTGSTLLCDLLASTGVAGKPDSFFHRPSISWWARHWNVPESLSAQDFNRAYLEAMLREGDGGTGIFGLRLMRENIDEVMARFDTLYPNMSDDAARFERVLGPTLYIHLSRSDKVAQAVSLVKASQSGLWHMAPDGTERERLAPPRVPVYDRDRIRQEVAELDAYDTAWNEWFERHSIDPVRVTYEALSDEPKSVLAGVLARLGLDLALSDRAVPGVAKLADDVSLEWIHRFRSEEDCRDLK